MATARQNGRNYNNVRGSLKLMLDFEHKSMSGRWTVGYKVPNHENIAFYTVRSYDTLIGFAFIFNGTFYRIVDMAHYSVTTSKQQNMALGFLGENQYTFGGYEYSTDTVWVGSDNFRWMFRQITDGLMSGWDKERLAAYIDGNRRGFNYQTYCWTRDGEQQRIREEAAAQKSHDCDGCGKWH